MGLWYPKWYPENSGCLVGTQRKSGSGGRSRADSGPLEAHVHHSSRVEFEPGHLVADADEPEGRGARSQSIAGDTHDLKERVGFH